MAISAIALCSRALLKLGARPIASFDEGTAEAEVAANLYPSLRDALLSAHAWSFATAQLRLPRLEAPPVADFDSAFQLPADFLRAISAGVALSQSALQDATPLVGLHQKIFAVTSSRSEHPASPLATTVEPSSANL